MFDCPLCDWLLFALSTIIALSPYYVLFFLLRPKLMVSKVVWEEEDTAKCGKRKVLRISVENLGYYSVNMLRVETCAVLADGTLHLATDLSDFVILPGRESTDSDNTRDFKADRLHTSATCYNYSWDEVYAQYAQGKIPIRVRVHGLHSISGLGRAVEFLCHASQCVCVR